jgi:hypothetical protein
VAPRALAQVGRVDPHAEQVPARRLPALQPHGGHAGRRRAVLLGRGGGQQGDDLGAAGGALAPHPLGRGRLPRVGAGERLRRVGQRPQAQLAQQRPLVGAQRPDQHRHLLSSVARNGAGPGRQGAAPTA